MTPQQLKAMKLALEALVTEQDIYREHDEDGAPEYILDAINAIEEALAEHAMQEVQRLGQEIEQALKIKTTDPFESSRVADYNRGWNDCLFASGVVKQTERHELQAKGEHPAPCARHCEANAFQIVIKNLKAQLAQPEQEPVAYATKEDFHRELERRLKHIREEMKIKSVTMRCKDYDIALPIIDTDFGRVLVGQVSTPPQRTWVNLTDEDRNDCLVEADPCECLATPEAQELMRCVEAKSRSKNT